MAVFVHFFQFDTLVPGLCLLLREVTLSFAFVFAAFLHYCFILPLLPPRSKLCSPQSSFKNLRTGY